MQKQFVFLLLTFDPFEIFNGKNYNGIKVDCWTD